MKSDFVFKLKELSRVGRDVSVGVMSQSEENLVFWYDRVTIVNNNVFRISWRRDI